MTSPGDPGRSWSPARVVVSIGFHSPWTLVTPSLPTSKTARPVVPVRNVFVALRAPFRAFQPSAMNGIVNSASRRAGVEPVTPHQLRHSAATQMLAAGASLAEIGQVLRHRDESTTAGRRALTNIDVPDGETRTTREFGGSIPSASRSAETG